MRRTILGGALVLLALTLAGCSGSHNGAGRSAVGGATVGGGRVPAGVPTPAPSSAGTANGGTPAPANDAPLARRAEIVTAELSVAIRAGQVAHAADEADAIAARAGGEVASDDRTSGAHATADVQLRVPPATVQNVLHQLGALGHVRSQQLSTTDVTQQVADVTSRVASARDSINRLRALYASAKKVADVIAIESELNSREADLESLEAQQRALDRQTAMATVTVSLVTAAVPPVRHPAKHARGGFVGGLEKGWDALSAAGAWLAAAFGAVLPFLVILVLAALGARLAWHRLPRRTAPPAPTPAPTPGE